MGRLFWKILIGFWLTLVLTAAGVGAAFYLYSQARLADVNDLADGPHVTTIVATAASVLTHGGREALQTLFRELPSRRRPPLLIVDGEGRELFERPIPAATLARAREVLAEGPTTPAIRAVTTPDGSDYLLFVPAQIRNERRPWHLSHQEQLAAQLSVALLVSLLFSAGLAWYLSRPVRHLRTASRRLAAGDLDARVMPDIGSRRDEIADLGADFDHMAMRLQNLVAVQKRLLHDVSHELRSPLARLQVAVALARQQPEHLARTLERIERETERLDELVGQVLTLSRLEAGVNQAATGYLDLAELLEEVAEDAGFEAESIGRHVHLETTADCVVQGQPELLRRAFENVVRNAIRYTAPETTVTIVMTRGTGVIAVDVCDTGPGVPHDTLDSLFEPFFRAATEAVPQRAGYGLGLAIARRAIEAHGGTIAARNRAEGGLCIGIELPLSGDT